MELYKWQKEIVNHKGDVVIVGGRQVGKSLGVSKRIAKLAVTYPNTKSLIIAASERQESYLFEKVESTLIQMGKLSNKRQTMSRLRLKNGSIVKKIPVGKTGYYVKGATVDFLYIDEAAYIPELVWDAVIPMLGVARSAGLGWMTLLSTAFGKRGYFYQCFKNDRFRKFEVTSHECTHLTSEYLKEELDRMGERRFGQEYLAKFLDDMGQYFPTDLITKCMNFKFWDKKITPDRRFYLGIDIGGMGVDEEAFACGEMIGKKMRNIYNDTLNISRMNDTLRMVDKLDGKLHFRRIFMDPAGIGEGYLDIMQERYGKRRVIGLNNASKSKEVFKRILKEDLYSNTLRLMEEGNLDLVMDEAMAKSLQSVLRDKDGKIGGKDDHLSEALVRMCWCVKEKGLNLNIV